MMFRVASLKQLSSAEFNGEKVKQQVYGNGHINVFGILYKISSIQRKVDFNEFVQNSLCCDMYMIILDLHGYGGC